LDTKERVAEYIYQNPENFFTQKNIEIAEILNIAPETLSRVIKAFKQDNLINLKLKTIDKETLKTYF
jgi:CRP/FNR family transcriptional regulator